MSDQRFAPKTPRLSREANEAPLHASAGRESALGISDDHFHVSDDHFHISDDHFHDECGVFAIHGHPEAANLAYLGLYALQHRGQESAGIASSDGRKLYCHKSMGHVAEIFTPEVLGGSPSATLAIRPLGIRSC
jgi:hypothetical protein